MTFSSRRLRGVASLTVAAVAATSIAVTAIQADGRPASTEETNDGGAWLLDRRASAVGHVDRATREVSGAVRAADAGSVFWVDQSASTVLVHDESRQTVTVVDGRTYATTATAPLGMEAEVSAIDGGLVVTTTDPLRVWQLPLEDFTSLEGDLVDVEATIGADVAGRAVVTPDDVVVAADDDGAARWRYPDGTEAEATFDPTTPLVGVTVLGEDLVAIDESARMTVTAPNGTPSTVELDPAAVADVVWQQPGEPAPVVVGTRPDGATILVDRVTGEVTTGLELDGTDPVAPIMHGGCVFALVRQPGTFARRCGDNVTSTPLTGYGGGDLTMRLVNGWVWINAVDTGQAWVVDESGDLEELDDVGNALEQDQDETEEEPEEGDSTRQRQDNDADEVGNADKLDEDGRNEPPVAEPEHVTGRQGEPIVVDVLRNDIDPDGDVLLVTSAGTRDDTARVEATGDQRYVQVTPPVDFTGTITFEYAISDGRGGTDGTTSTLEVIPADADNRKPEPETDFVAAAPGAAATLDVLANDVDPDGDTLLLGEVTGEEMTVVSAPDGEITVTPDQGSSGELELTYTVADSFGATATGRVRVDVRTVEEANRPPDARNDSGATTIDKPVVFNVLDNDSDPDGDRITVSGQPEPVSVPNGGGNVHTSLSPDGVFLIDAPVAGDYVFRYQVSDGAFSDPAQIRVLVREEADNRPPIAVRDDAVIPLGATRVVQALRNDSDPDGDVVAITGWSGSSGLVVERITQVGFRVTVLPTASPREVFTYEISDGLSEPVVATVVVTVAEATGQDQRPVALPDVVEVQPGQSVAVPVLRNDFDPEGGALEVVSVTEREDATLAPGGAGQSVIVTLPQDARLGFTFGYEIADQAGNRASSTVEVQVVPPGDRNRAPFAVPDITTTLERTPVVVDVLANDTDPDGDALQVESIAMQPAGGSAEILPDGTVEYTPSGDFTGTDRLSYALVDARGARVTGDVLIGVMPLPEQNRPPVAVPDNAVVVAGSSRGLLDVLVNDLDPDGDRLVVTDVSDVGLGTVEVSDDGSAVAYTPPGEPTDGQDRQVAFRYSIDDGAGHTVDGTVTVDILAEPEPIPPIANDDLAGPTTAGETVVVEVLANDRDPDGDPADLEVSSADEDVRVRRGGRLAITPGDATRSYVYEVTDADGLTATAAVTVIVVENRAPVVESRQVTTAFETPVEVDVTRQATDPDGDRLLYVCCDQVRGGTPEIVSANATRLRVRFVPNPGFEGEAGFAFTVDDDHGHQVSGTVLVTVEPKANTPPEVAARDLDAEVGRTTTLDLQGLVTDPDEADEHTFELSDVSGPMAVERAGDRVVVEPEITSTGATGSFTVTATDAAGESGSGTVTVALTPSTLPPPEATGDTARTHQADEVTIPVLTNDIGDGLRVVSASSPDGTTEVLDRERVLFRPDDEFFGTAIVTYTIDDEQRTAERQATAQVHVDVIGFPGKPATPAVVADSREATVTWTAPAANGAPITSYVLEHDQGGSIELGTTTTHQWTGLDNGTEYRFRVRADNEAGPSEWSDWSVPVVPNEVPGRPAAPEVDFGDTRLDVTWAEPANDGTEVLRYELEIGGGTSGSQEVPPGGATTAYTWENLANGTNYQFRVRAINAAGESDWSTWSATEHPLTTPDAPAKPTVDNGPNYLQVTWQPPYDGGDTIQRYQVQKRPAGGGEADQTEVSGASTSTYRWGELANGELFQFRIRAINRAEPIALGWSEWSAPAKACDVPAAVAQPGVSRGDRQVAVSWTAPATNGCAISGYDIQHDRASTVHTAGASANTHTWTDLANGTTYRFRVRARNEQGNGPWSAWSPEVTPAGKPFTVPNVQAARTTSTGQVRVTWGPADDNGESVDEYRIFIDGTLHGTVGGSATGYTRSSLQPGRQYRFDVAAVNAIGQGPKGGPAHATPAGPPDRVGGLTVNDSTRGQLTWNWSRPDGNGAGVDRYRVDWIGGQEATGDLWVSGSQYTRTGLGDDARRGIRVRACNSYGCGSWTGISYGTTKPPPPPEQRIEVAQGSGTGSRDGCASGTCEWARLALRDWAANRAYGYSCDFSVAGRPASSRTRTYTYWKDGSSVRTNGGGDAGYKEIWCFIGVNTRIRIYIHDANGNVIKNSGWRTY